jgi:hypothetical protein
VELSLPAVIVLHAFLRSILRLAGHSSGHLLLFYYFITLKGITDLHTSRPCWVLSFWLWQTCTESQALHDLPVTSIPAAPGLQGHRQNWTRRAFGAVDAKAVDWESFRSGLGRGGGGHRRGGAQDTFSAGIRAIQPTHWEVLHRGDRILPVCLPLVAAGSARPMWCVVPLMRTRSPSGGAPQGLTTSHMWAWWTSSPSDGEGVLLSMRVHAAEQHPSCMVQNVVA